MREGERGLHLTQSRLGRGLAPYLDSQNRVRAMVRVRVFVRVRVRVSVGFRVSVRVRVSYDCPGFE